MASGADRTGANRFGTAVQFARHLLGLDHVRRSMEIHPALGFALVALIFAVIEFGDAIVDRITFRSEEREELLLDS